MQPIPIATKKEFESKTPFKGKFIIEPLYPGYGLTLGNALRRVLLSSLEGVAITSIKLKGAEHEFSAIEGVKEDVVDIILNLKQIRFEVAGQFEEAIKIQINTKGTKEIKAGDFKKVAGVKIANPDLHIATLTDSKAEFELKAWLEKGRGYLPTEMMNSKEKEVGVIAIDAIFSPVKKISIDTENVRVGEMTNWDRLIIDLETDGTLTPEESLKQASKILVEQFSFFLTDVKEVAAETKNKEIKPARDITREVDEEQEEETKNVQEIKAETKETSVEEIEVEKKPKKRGRPKKNL